MATSICNPTATSSLRLSSSSPFLRTISPTTCSSSSSASLRLNRSIRHTPPRARWREHLRRIPSIGRLSVRCSAVSTIDQSEFSEKVLGSDLPVLVEFVAHWCGPCRLISPVIDWASQEYKDRLKVVKVDHDANPQLIEEYKVYGLPALILFKNGKEVPESRREGAMTKVKLKDYLDSLLDSITVA